MKKWIWMISLLGWIGCARQPVHMPEWSQDLNAVAEAARAQNKMLLLNFSGSDWCHWCVRLDEEVFSQPGFQQFAEENLEVVLIDFPRRKTLPAEVRERNDRLLRHFGVRGFPSLLLFSPEGELMGRLGYQPGGPDALIQSIRETQARHNLAAPGASPATRLPL